MQRILSSLLPAQVGQRVTIAGWVHRRRVLKSVAFLIVRDSAGLAQVVVSASEVRAAVEALTEESVIEVTGTVAANDVAPGGVEIVEPLVRVISPAEPVPFDLYRPAITATLPTLLDHAAVALRHPSRQAAFRISAAAVAGFRSTLDQAGFVEVHTPKMVASATESGANVFALDYFGRPAYLAQSPQFYKQMLVGVFERVYEVGPVFRAEPHDTVRHLAQYTSLDVELGFIEDHRDVMAVLRETLAGMMSSIASRAEEPVAALGLKLPEVPAQIPSVAFADALAMVGAPADEPDLAPAHERWLGQWAQREHGSEFLFVTGYPMRKRPFYTHPDPADPSHSNGFDLIFRGIELVTGGQRLHRYADYVTALAARGESTEPYQSYLDVFRHGMVGEANVVDKMLASEAVFGGEGSGGPIDPRVGFVRDSFVGMALVLAAMAERRKKVSELADELPRYEIVKRTAKLPPDQLPAAFDAVQKHFADATSDRLDGLRLDWPDRWLIVRGSNTEPIVRIIAEAPTAEAAEKLVASAGEVIGRL